MKETPTALDTLQDFNSSVQKCLKPTGICSKFLPKTFQILISRRVGPCQGLSDALHKAVSDRNDFQVIAKLTVHYYTRSLANQAVEAKSQMVGQYFGLPIHPYL